MASTVEELVKGRRVPTYRYRPRLLAKSMHFIKTGPARRLTNMATLQEMVKPLVSIPKPVSISKAALEGQKATVDNVNFFLPEDMIIWAVTYKNNMKRSINYSYRQEINGAVDSGESLTINAGEEVTKRKPAFPAKAPRYITGKAEVSMEPKIKMLTDSVSRSFGVGILRFKDKPVAEYPVPDAENAVADYDLWDWAKGLEAEFGYRPPGAVTGPTWEFLHPFVKAGDRFFKHPAADNVLRASFNVKNIWSEPIDTWSYDSHLGVVYEDHKHASVVVFPPAPTRASLQPGEDVDFVTSMVFPAWAYGKMVFEALIAFEYIREDGVKKWDYAGGHFGKEIGLQEYP